MHARMYSLFKNSSSCTFKICALYRIYIIHYTTIKSKKKNKAKYSLHCGIVNIFATHKSYHFPSLNCLHSKTLLFLLYSPQPPVRGAWKESKEYILNDRQNAAPRLPPILSCCCQRRFLVGGSKLHKACDLWLSDHQYSL